MRSLFPNLPTRRVRIAVQAFWFALWGFLVLSTHHPMDAWILKVLPASLLLRMDPLVATVVLGGMRTSVQILFLAFVTLGISVLLGRVFCGWVCPLGSLFDFVGFWLRRARVPFEGPSPSWFRLKYYLLAAILCFALLGGMSPLIGLDPIVLITRTAATVLGPLLRHSSELSWTVGAPVGTRGALIDLGTLLLFIAILAATTRLSRIWCRTACPLGAYLALGSRHAALRRQTQDCIHCNICSQHCPTGAISFTNPEVYNESECIKCFACSEECPVDANFFALRSPLPAFMPSYAPVSLERRALVGTAVSAVAAAPALQLAAGEPGSAKTLLRPPMSREERDFLTSCIRCGECMKACPTGILKPSGLENGLRALWTPVMVPTEGECKQGCNACSQACPTDAILKYAIEDKYRFKAGTAVFDTSRCISFTENKYCSECVRACPTQAITTTQGWTPEDPSHGSDMPAPAGQTPARPLAIVFDRCVGCGACEKSCNEIVLGAPAMVTTSFGRATPTQL